MAILKKQAIENLDRALSLMLQSVTKTIDNKLANHIAGDTAYLSFEEIGLSTQSPTVYNETIKLIKEDFKEQGWDVEVATDSNNKKSFKFK